MLALCERTRPWGVLDCTTLPSVSLVDLPVGTLCVLRALGATLTTVGTHLVLSLVGFFVKQGSGRCTASVPNLQHTRLAGVSTPLYEGHAGAEASQCRPRVGTAPLTLLPTANDGTRAL